MDFLQDLKKVTHVNPNFWNDIEKILTARSIKKEEIYSREGDYVKKIGVLLSGVMRIYHLDKDGNEWNKAFLQKNAFLLTNINTENRTKVYFEALTECNIIEIPISFFLESMNKYPEIQKLYQREIGDLFERKSEREADLLKLDAKQRYLKFKRQFPDLQKNIPQYHIASYLGITPTQLSRIKISCQNQQM